MKRILLLVTVALMLAAAMALSGVAQAAQGGKADAQCKKLARQTLPNFKPAHYTFHGGTEGGDSFTGQATEGPDVFCGFGNGEGIGDVDSIATLNEGDIFLGGAGNDQVDTNNGTFYGGEGNDIVIIRNNGTFYGGPGDDTVDTNEGTFDGGDGTDTVNFNFGTIINVEQGDV
jgi:hypothetical protein